MPSGTRTIETERLVLRRFTLDDAEVMYNTWASDPVVTRYMTWTPHRDAAETRRILTEWVAAYDGPEPYYHWAITLKGDVPGASGTLIGSLGIAPACHYETGMEPGYCIGRPFWGKGYTTEALAAALDYYIKDTGDTDLHCCHAAENPASGRVMQKCGFVYDREGSFKRQDGAVLAARLYNYKAQTRKD